MYKDKERQREANRQAKSRQRRRDSRRQPKGMTDEPSNVIPKTDIPVIPKQGITKGITNRVLPKEALISDEIITSLQIASAKMDAGCGDKLKHGLKRGKDIKVFEDLSPGVQVTIRKLSTDKRGLLNQREFINRTAIAVNYQHQFPDRFHSTGVAI